MITDFEYEVILDDAGNVTLTQGNEVMWDSSQDDDFKEDWGASDITGDELDEVATWLVDEDYLPPGVEVHFVDDLGGDDWMDDVSGTDPEDETDDEEGND